MTFGHSRNRARCSERDTALVVTETLQFLFLIESLWPKARRPLSVTARWCRLALVFLAGNFFFSEILTNFLFFLNTCFLQQFEKNNIFRF